MQHPNNSKLIGIAGAAVALLGTGALVFRTLRSRDIIAGRGRAADSLPVTLSEVEEWSVGRVASWLQSLGVSKDTQKLFNDNDVDGQVLGMLQNEHLREMGVTKIADRMRILKALDRIRSPSTNPVPVMQASRPEAIDVDDDAAPDGLTQTIRELRDDVVTSPLTEEYATAPASGQPTPLTMQQQTIASAVIRRLEDLYRIFADESFIRLPREEQREFLQQAQAQFVDIQADIQKLPPSHQQQLTPFATNFGLLLKKVDEMDKANSRNAQYPSSSASASAQSEEMPEAASAQVLSSAIPMLQEFYRVIDSPAMDSAPLQKRQEVCRDIAQQVNRMKTIAAKLHPKHKESLCNVCDRLLSAAQSKQGAAAPSDDNASAAAPTAIPPSTFTSQPAPRTASPAFLMQRLRALFDTLRNPKFLQSLTTMPPNEISNTVRRMETELDSITHDAQGVEDPEQQTMILDVVANVTSILEQISALNPEHKQQQQQQPQQQKQQQQQQKQQLGEERKTTETQDRARAMLPGYAIAEKLKNTLKVIQSAEFQRNPQPKHATLVENVRECRQKISTLKDANEKAQLGTLCDKISELLQLAVNSAEKRAPQKAQKTPPTPTQADDADAPRQGSDAFWTIKTNLEAIYRVLASSGFQSAEPTVQMQQAQRLDTLLQEQLERIQSMIQSPEERNALMELWRSLNAIVERLNAIGNEYRNAEEKLNEQEAKEQEAQGTEAAQAHFQARHAQTPSVNAAMKEQQNQGTGQITVQGAIERLQKIYSIVQSDEFLGMESERQRTVATALYSALEELTQDIENASELDESESLMMVDRVMPLITQLQRVLGKNVIGKTAGAGTEEAEQLEEEQEEDEEQETDERGIDDIMDSSDSRKSLFNTAQHAAQLIRRNKIKNSADANECLSLLGELDKVGTMSEEEQAIYDDFVAALKELTLKLRQDNNNAQTSVTVKTLIETMKKIGNELQGDFISQSQLLPFMKAVEETLAEADKEGCDWQAVPEAVAAVADTLGKLQNIQDMLANSGTRRSSPVEETLNKGIQALQAGIENGEITTAEHLAPFMELAQKCKELEAIMTIEDRTALLALQKAVLAALSNIKKKSPSRKSKSREETSPEQTPAPTGNVDADFFSPTVRPAAPPNTPAHFNSGGGRDASVSQSQPQMNQSPKNGKGEASAVEELSDEDESTPMSRHKDTGSNKKATTSNDNNNNNTNNNNSNKTDDADLVKDIANEPVIGEGRAGELIPGGLEEELSLLQRIMDRLHMPEGSSDSDEDKDFVSNTTLFELQCISKLLIRLSGCCLFKDTSIAELVNQTKHEFATKLSAFHPSGDALSSVQDRSSSSMRAHEASKDPQSTMFDAPVLLTGMRSENESSDEPIVHYTIFSREENGEDTYTVDKSMIAPLLRSEEDETVCTPIVQSTVSTSETDISLAIVVAVRPPKRTDDEDGQQAGNKTVLAELTMLCDILGNDYGFDTAVFVDDALSKEELLSVITTTMERCVGSGQRISRLLFYFHTPKPSGMSPRNYAVTFADGSTVSHREVMTAAIRAVSQPVGEALLVHDAESSLQVLAAVPTATEDNASYQWSAHLAVTLTEGAKCVVNASRCWLYDGLFTPIICELLTVGVSTLSNPLSLHQPGSTVWICPEDIVNYATLVIAGAQASADANQEEVKEPTGHQLPRLGRAVLNDKALATCFVTRRQ